MLKMNQVNLKRICAFFLTSLLFACETGYPGSGLLQTQIRTVTPFSAVSLHQGFRLNYRENNQRSSYDLQISTDHNLFGLVSTEVTDSRLDIRLTQPVQASRLQAELEGPTLRGLILTGRSSATANRLGGQPQTDLNLTGQSSLTIENLESDQVNVYLSSQSRLTLQAGRVAVLSLKNISGGSEVLARNLVAGQVDVVMSGTSTARVQATRSLVVSLSGGATLYYVGNPQIDVRQLSDDSQLLQLQ